MGAFYNEGWTWLDLGCRGIDWVYLVCYTDERRGYRPAEARQEQPKMIDAIFDWCVRLLVFMAGQLGITYKAINVWVFVIIWPVFTLVLIGLLIVQWLRIRRLTRTMGNTR